VAFTTVVPTALGQAASPDVLRAAALTTAELPRGLALDEQRSGLRTTAEGPAYTATFMADGTGDPSLMGVVNTLGQYPDAAAGLDTLADRFRTGLGGSPTDLPAPAVGEASRAFTTTSRVMGGAMTTSTAFVALRRGDVVAGVAVASVGDTPQVAEALRLAEAVDRRLTAALGPGA
jgi:hypothetical protein